VDSSLIESKRFLIVGLLSSAASTPFCFATMACATDLSSSTFMGYLLFSGKYCGQNYCPVFIAQKNKTVLIGKVNVYPQP
jgi:hypothetical protein